MTNNPANQASELLNSIGWTSPEDMSIEEIAWASGLITKKESLDGCEGRIVMGADSGV